MPRHLSSASLKLRTVPPISTPDLHTRRGWTPLPAGSRCRHAGRRGLRDVGRQVAHPPPGRRPRGDLHRRVHAGTYRALPSRGVFIPNVDGQMRPLDVAALEDKVVQQAVATVLGAIWEEDFLGLSYGFRPGRGPHDALDALWVGLMRKKVSGVFDADLHEFFVIE